MICRNAKVCSGFNEISCRSGKYVDLCVYNNDADMKKRKVKAFNWLAKNIDNMSIEYTGTHYHIYEGQDESLTRIGNGESTLLLAVESCYT